MNEMGPESINEKALRIDKRRFYIVSIIAAVVCLPFVLTHIIFATAMLPSFIEMYAHMEEEIPTVLQMLITLNQNGFLAVLFPLVDVVIFIIMYWLAKRYWIGLLFAPIFIYLAISSVLIQLIYMPMFNIITLIK